MKITTLRSLLPVMMSAALIMSCHHEAIKPKPAATEISAAAINNAVIRKSPNDDRNYAALMLPNNLQVILVSDPSLENSAASLAVAVGSAQDPEDRQGLAHYLEHMLFLGTEKYPVPEGFMKYTQENGGMTNAFTAYDKTNYHFQINAKKFETALDMFSEFFKSPTFDANFSDKERHAVNNEWSLQKAQDQWNIFRLDGLLANPQNPQFKFNIGNLETLVDRPDATLISTMKSFYDRYYSANLMRLTLVGKQSIPELKALAEKHFASIPNKNRVAPTITAVGLTDAEKSKNIFYKPIKDLKALYVDYPVKNNKTEWRLKPNEFIRNLITSEEPGTLGDQMRQKGLGSVTAEFQEDQYGPDGYLRIQVTLTDKGLKQKDDVIAAIFSYVNVIKREKIDAQLYRERQAISAKDFEHATKLSPGEQAVELTMKQFEVPIENVLDSEYLYESYNEAAINRVLGQLDNSKTRIWHISKQETAEREIPFFDGKYRVENFTQAQVDTWNRLSNNYSFNLPPLNNLFTDKPAPIVDNNYLKPHQVISAPGIEAFLVHPEFYREDKGLLQIEINSPNGQKNPKAAVLASLLNEIYQKENVALIDRAYNASLELRLNTNAIKAQVISISGYTTKHPLLAEEMLKQFTNLEVSEQSFREALDSYKQAIANESKGHVFRQLYSHFGRLVLTKQSRSEELLAAAQSVKLQEVVDYHRGLKNNPLLRIFAAGNYSEQDITQIASRASQLLPSTKKPEARTLPIYALPKAGKTIEFKDSVNLADNALLQAWFRDATSDEELAQLEVLNALFSNAFFLQLRTQEQLGYVVISNSAPVNETPGFLTVVQSSNSDLTKIKASMDKFRKNYLGTLTALDPLEIEQTKQSIIANIMQKPTDFYKEAERYLKEFEKAKYRFDSRERRLAALQKVSKDDLLKIYQALILNDKSSGLLLQMRGTNFKDAPFATRK